MTLDILFTILLLLGLLLTCIPTLPGVPLMFGMILVYAIIDKFEVISALPLAIFGAIALLSIAIDWGSGLLGAKLGGASKKALLYGMLGMMMGLFVFPPFGLFIGLFLGVFIAELVQFKSHHKALKAASYSLATTVVGAFANIALGLGTYITFLVLIWR